MFAKSTDGGSSWATSVVDSQGSFRGPSSIDAPDASNVFISYKDSVNSDLRFAKSTDGGSSWATSMIDGEGSSSGGYNSIDAVDADTAFIGYFNSIVDGDLNVAKYSSPYYSSGVFNSSIINAGNLEWGAIDWATSTPAGTGVTFKARTSDSPTMDGAPDFSTCDDITKNVDISSNNCVTDGQGYIQYQAMLTTSNGSVSPTIDDVTINYDIYNSSGSLISSPYDAEDAANVLSSVSWSENLATSTDIKFQLRTSPDGLNWTEWWGPDSTSTYFTD
jgi:hypothetical protein